MTKTIFLIAGEASGDALGAKLMKALKECHPERSEGSPAAGDPSPVAQDDSEIKFLGVGGERMAAEGLASIFPMEELSLLGFVEIVPHIPKLLKRIEQVAEEILRAKPDIVVTIDAPAFNHRVARKLRDMAESREQRAESTPHHPASIIHHPLLVHYVAPTVWAYKPERAAKIAKLYNHLLVILPFEPPYFEKEGLPTTFVGHPILEEDVADGDGTAFRAAQGIPADVPLLGIMPGSRSGELKRLLPVFRETTALLKRELPNLRAVMFATARFAERLKAETAGWPIPVTVIAGREGRKDALAACNVALAKSGTGTLEFALARVPMAVAYKVNPLSAWMLRRMIQVQHVNLINLVLGKSAIPELLQEECTPLRLAQSLIPLFRNDDARLAQTLAMHTALGKLRGDPALSPSRKAAQTLLALMAG